MCEEEAEDALINLSASVQNSYSAEWQLLFEKPNYLAILKAFSLKGMLRRTQFRSICWKLYLEVLPEDRSRWIEQSRRYRMKYTMLKESLAEELRSSDSACGRSEDGSPVGTLTAKTQSSRPTETGDTGSGDTGSAGAGHTDGRARSTSDDWSRPDRHELRTIIEQDVVRTYPRIQFFHVGEIQEMMTTILLVFAHLNPDLAYRQGMHELLAPILFVLHCDHQTFEHASELEELPEIVREVLDPAYIEHDAFAMFCQVMETVEDWYVSRGSGRALGGSSLVNINNNSVEEGEGGCLSGDAEQVGTSVRPHPSLTTSTFSSASSNSSSSSKPATHKHRSRKSRGANALLHKLSNIEENILSKHDPELCQHLKRLDIPPQIYGIKWVRLLFGREFTLHDLLVLWDAIFAYNTYFELVDYLFVAMMLNIRETLLRGDYTDCLNALMRYPPVLDVLFFVRLALHLRDPMCNRPPRGFQPPTLSRFHSSSGQDIWRRRLMAPDGASGSSAPDQTLRRASTIVSGWKDSLTRKIRQDPIFAGTPLYIDPKRPASSRSGAHSASASMIGSTARAAFAGSSPSITGNGPLLVTTGASPTPTAGTAATIEKLRMELHDLQNKLSNYDDLCLYAATELDNHIAFFQRGLLPDLDQLNVSSTETCSFSVEPNEEVGGQSSRHDLLMALAGLKQVRDILRGSLSMGARMAPNSTANNGFLPVDAAATAAEPFYGNSADQQS